MAHSTLDPVFTGLRLGLYGLLLGLTGFTIARAFIDASPHAVWTLVVGLTFIGVYLSGARFAQKQEAAPHGRRFGGIWLVALTVLWAILIWLRPEGAYLVFPLFFLYLHILSGARGVAAVVATTTFAILALGLHSGFSVGGVVGPLVGAGVALLTGYAYRALQREAEEREHLLSELIRTRQLLAQTEREQGALAERARLAREIHDTVAQGLSSIQMLLRAAERDTPEPSAGYLRLARETAAGSLADTRQIVRELTPSRLDDGLAAALRRLGQEQSRLSAIPIEVSGEELGLPMSMQAAFLRIAQGALSNAIRHANPTSIAIELQREKDAVCLVVRDDGCGFDSTDPTGTSAHDSFGIQAMRERVGQLDGTLVIDSTPGHGTSITAKLPLTPDSDAEA